MGAYQDFHNNLAIEEVVLAARTMTAWCSTPLVAYVVTGILQWLILVVTPFSSLPNDCQWLILVVTLFSSLPSDCQWLILVVTPFSSLPGDWDTPVVNLSGDTPGG